MRSSRRFVARRIEVPDMTLAVGTTSPRHRPVKERLRTDGVLNLLLR